MVYESIGDNSFVFTLSEDDFSDEGVYYDILDSKLSDSEMNKESIPIVRKAMDTLFENNEIEKVSCNVTAAFRVNPSDEEILLKLDFQEINPIEALMSSLLGGLGGDVQKFVEEMMEDAERDDDYDDYDDYDTEVISSDAPALPVKSGSTVKNSSGIAEDVQTNVGVDKKEVYYLFDSMSKVIHFCENISSSDVISSELYKMTDHKSPILKDKYVIQLDLRGDVDTLKYSEFAQFLPNELHFKSGMIEHAETIIGVDAVSKLKMVA